MSDEVGACIGSFVKSLVFRCSWHVQGGCCLEDAGDAKNSVSVEASTLAGVCASRMRNTLKLLEGLLDILVDIDENAVLWEPEVN